MHSDTLVSIRNIVKRFSHGHTAVTVIKGITLEVTKGEFVAIMGPSGSGKTTLTHILGGLIKPSSGEVLVAGKSLKMRSDKAMSWYRNEKIGFVLQSFGLIPYYTALENVVMPLIVRGVSRYERNNEAQRVLNAVGLASRVHYKAQSLSGGERQRVAIARALISRPEIIIADEPTGSLDSARGAEVMDLLAKLCREQGVSVVLVTHDLAIAKRADRIVYLRDGKLEGRAA